MRKHLIVFTSGVQVTVYATTLGLNAGGCCYSTDATPEPVFMEPTAVAAIFVLDEG